MLPVSRYGIIEYLSLQFADNFALRFVGSFDKIVHVHPSVIVERTCQRFGRGKYQVGVYTLERYGFKHYIGFRCLAVSHYLYGADLHSRYIERDDCRVVCMMQTAPPPDKGIIPAVEFFP